jgi:hypothetical protein
MKKLFIALLIFFLTGRASAECNSWGISVWPRTNEISLNSLIIIEGYFSSQEVIRGLNKKYTIYLKADTTIISLDVIKTYEGQYSLTQALLRPTSKLISKTTYTLHIDSLDQYEKEDFYSNSFKWTVTDRMDNEPPNWLRTPILFNKQKIHYGCGPAKFVDFCVCYQDNSSVVIFAKLKEIKTDKIYEYLVTPDSTLLRIGHGMCAGEFDFEDGEKYEISFGLMDASGNRNDTLTKPIQFNSPTDKDTGKNKEKIYCECPKSTNEKKSNLGIIIFLATTLLFMSGLIFYARKRKAAANQVTLENFPPSSSQLVPPLTLIKIQIHTHPNFEGNK